MSSLEPKSPALTMTVVEAAKQLGIGRNQAYAAARRGELPVIRIGKRLVVPLAAFERMMQGDGKSWGITKSASEVPSDGQ